MAEIGADSGTVSITFLLFGLVFAVSTPITGIVSFPWRSYVRKNGEVNARKSDVNDILHYFSV